jgi:hypothetical protein
MRWQGHCARSSRLNLAAHTRGWPRGSCFIWAYDSAWNVTFAADTM